MSSERLNRTAVKDARLKDLLLERGTPSFVRGARAGWAAGARSPPYRSKTRPGRGALACREPWGGGEVFWPGGWWAGVWLPRGIWG